MSEQDKDYQYYMDQIKAQTIRLSDIPKEHLSGQGVWLSVSALLRDGSQYSEIPREYRNFGCLCAALVGGGYGGNLIRDTDSKYFTQPISYAISKSHCSLGELDQNRINGLISEVNPQSDLQVQKHPRKYKRQGELNLFTDALHAKIIIEAMEHDCITFDELSDRYKVNPYISRYAVYRDHKNILRIPDDYSHDLINGKSLKADIRSEIFSHYLDGRDKPPYELIKQKVNHIINEELYERFNRNPAFTPVPDVSIAPSWTKDNPKTTSRAR